MIINSSFKGWIKRKVILLPEYFISRKPKRILFSCHIRGGRGTGLPVPRIFVPGTWVPKLKIPGLSQGFLSQFQESQGFASHGTTLGLPEFLGLLGTRVPGTVPGFWNFSKKKHYLLITNAAHFLKMNPYCTQIKIFEWNIKISIKVQIKKRSHEATRGPLRSLILNEVLISIFFKRRQIIRNMLS